MAARVLGAAACLRRVLPTTAARASRVIQPASFVAGRRFATVGNSTADGAASGAAGKKRRTASKAILNQVQYMTDPWHLGKYIEDLLAKNKLDDALTTVELASKNLDTVVSWNHIINHLLKQQQIKKAVTTFNNMKKRGIFPNAQTYTIMFRGFAASQHPKNALTEAVKLFTQLKNDRRLQPNTIHLNAVLQVCSRAGDIDQLFIVAGELEDLGLTATPATYNVIFNSMRQYVWREYGDLDKDTKQANVDKMIGRGQKIWLEVVDKWQQGKLKLDESLVCSMGRLQLLSKDRQDKLKVLDLVEQTMNIPNLVKKKSSSSSSMAPEDSTALTTKKDLRKGSHVRPGQNTLALILTTLLTGRQTGAAAPYWNLLVHDKKLVPDNDNWLRMIGVLKQSKSSAQAAQVLDTLPSSGIDVQARSFGIAMETCIRDNMNPHVMTHATRILHTMQERLAPHRDMHTMRLYLRAALVSHAAFRGRAGTGDHVGAKAAYGRQIATALAELWHPYIALYNLYFKSDAAVTAAAAAAARTADDVHVRAQKRLYTNQKEVIALGRMMVGAFSKVVEENMLPGNDNRDMIIASARINKGVVAFFADRELREPKLNQKATAAREREEAARGSPEEQDEEEKTTKKSVFEIDMPDLDDNVSSSDAKHKQQDKGKMRQGSDFVWNTRKLGNTEQYNGRQQAPGVWTRKGADKPVIDQWVSKSIANDKSPQTEETKTDDFVPIKPVAEAANEASENKAKSSEASGESIWATLMTERKAS